MKITDVNIGTDEQPVQRVITEPSDMLRAAAAWLNLAAGSLDRGRDEEARKFARMGKMGVDSHMLTRWMLNDPVPK